MLLTPDQINDSFEAIQALFRQVRPIILENAGKVAHTDKDDGTPSTDIDIQVEKIILAELTRKFPDMPFLSEEAGYDDVHAGAAWLIDPIDGTKSFIQNIPAFTCMAVLIQNDEIISSIIYNPSTDTMYTARKGQGAYKDNERLDLKSMPLPETASCRERLVDGINELIAASGVRCEARASGAGYGFSSVADGASAARFNFPHQPGGGYIHDNAPGALLVQEAGGAIVPFDSDVFTYKTRSFVACHPELEPVVRQHAKAIRQLELETAK